MGQSCLVNGFHHASLHERYSGCTQQERLTRHNSSNSETNLELHVVIVVHRVWPKPSTAEVTAAATATAAVAASHNTTNKHYRLHSTCNTSQE